MVSFLFFPPPTTWSNFDSRGVWGAQRLGVVLMLLCDNRAMLHLKRWTVLTQADWWTGCSRVSPGFLQCPRPVCFSGWEILQSTCTPAHICTPTACTPRCHHSLPHPECKHTVEASCVNVEYTHYSTYQTHCLQIYQGRTDIFLKLWINKIKPIGSSL